MHLILSEVQCIRFTSSLCLYISHKGCSNTWGASGAAQGARWTNNCLCLKPSLILRVRLTCRVFGNIQKSSTWLQRSDGWEVLIPCVFMLYMGNHTDLSSFRCIISLIISQMKIIWKFKKKYTLTFLTTTTPMQSALSKIKNFWTIGHHWLCALLLVINLIYCSHYWLPKRSIAKVLHFSFQGAV